MSWDNEDFPTIYNNVFTIAFAVVALLMPFYTSIFHGWNIDKMDDEDFSNKFCALYSGLNLDEKDSKRKSGLFYPFFFVVRRLLFFVAAIFLQDFLWGQLAIQFFCSITMIIYLLYWWPFETPFFTKIEVLNEVTSILLVYHLFMFTDWLPLAQTRYIMGWSFITVTVMNLAFHLFNLISNSVSSMRMKCRRTHHKWVMARSVKAKATKAEVEQTVELSQTKKPKSKKKKRVATPETTDKETSKLLKSIESPASPLFNEPEFDDDIEQ